jgi:hypothetical protein
MKVSQMFSRPLLIYDDKCSSCTRFAKTAKALSRGWIRVAGHYYSNEAREAKGIVFPADFDATKMFWLINRSGAYGARRALLQVMKEIIVGLFRGKRIDQVRIDWENSFNSPESCKYTSQSVSCESAKNTLKRFISMIRNSDALQFQD